MFGIMELMKGFDFIVVVIGFFGIGEILLIMEEGLFFKGVRVWINSCVVWEMWKILLCYWCIFVWGCFIGFWMGFKLGGAMFVFFMSYAFVKCFSKYPEWFGKGEIEGVVVSEMVVHVVGGASLLFMIMFGIFGSSTAVVMLGGFIINVEDARVSIVVGADAFGFIFVEGTLCYICLEVVVVIIVELFVFVMFVGVFWDYFFGYVKVVVE